VVTVTKVTRSGGSCTQEKKVKMIKGTLFGREILWVHCGGEKEGEDTGEIARRNHPERRSAEELSILIRSQIEERRGGSGLRF